MKSYTLLAPVLASRALAQSALAECYRDDSPDWNDCSTLYDQLGWSAGDPTELTLGCNRDTDIGGSCMAWYNGYCQMGWCFTDPSTCAGTSIGRLHTSHTILKSQCERFDSGGRIHEDGGYFEIVRNRNAEAGGGSRRRSLEVKKEVLTQEEFDQLFGSEHEIHRTHLVDEKNLKEKRQDRTWTNLVTYRGVTQPGNRIEVSPELSSGVEYTWTTSSSESVSISTTAGVSASLFEIFSASMEITAGYETSYSVGESLTYTSGDCPGVGVIYWSPVFDMYGGVWSDDPNTNVEIWVALELNGKANGRFSTECRGTAPP